jgi:hypothetical protein
MASALAERRPGGELCCSCLRARSRETAVRRFARPFAAAAVIVALAGGLTGCGLHRTRIYLYQPCDICGD